VVHLGHAHCGVLFFVLEVRAAEVVVVAAVEVGCDDVAGQSREGLFEVDGSALGAVAVEFGEETANAFMDEGLEVGDGLSGEVGVQDGASHSVSVVMGGGDVCSWNCVGRDGGFVLVDAAPTSGVDDAVE